MALSSKFSPIRKDPEDGKLHTSLKQETFISLIAAPSYGLVSLAMVLVNKAVLMQYPHSLVLLTLQQVAAVILLGGGGLMDLLQMRPLDGRTARRLLPLALCYNANVAFALASLQGINIPMYIALKRLTPLAVLITGAFTHKAKPPPQVLATFPLISLVYVMALTSVFFQTTYLVLVEKSGAEDGLSSSELMLYNSILSLPFLTLLITWSGELGVAGPLLLDKMKDMGFAAMVVGSLAMGLVLNFTMFLCTLVNSALTTTIVGVLKGVGATILGFLFLGRVEVRALNVLGLVINTAGGIWYSIAKYRQKSRKPHTDMSTSK